MLDGSTNFCKGITRDGKPCRARPTANGLCYFHANPHQARILGQKGGRGNRYPLTEVVVPADVTGATLGTLLDQAMAEVLAGRMNPRVASTISQLIGTRFRLTEKIELEARVANLERKLANRGNAAPAQASPASEERAVPLWWMPPENGNEGGGNGSGNNGKA